MARLQYLECGKIINTHGFRGQVKAEPWCDSAADLAKLSRVFVRDGEVYREMKISGASVLGGRFVVMKPQGVDDEATAEALKGTVLYASRDDVKTGENSYFLAETEGLPVIDAENGTVYGTVREVLTGGASPLFAVDTPTGEVLVPAVPAFVKRVDAEAGVYISPIGGMFDGDDETV